MIRLIFPLLAIAFVSMSVMADDGFLLNLRNVKHIGLSVDERLSAYTIQIYTPLQYKGHVQSLEEWRKVRSVNAQRIRDDRSGHPAPARNASENRASAEEMNALDEKFRREMIHHPGRAFENTVKLHTVTAVRDNYIAIAPLDDPQQTVLIPASRIGRITLPRPETMTETVPTDVPAAASPAP